MTIRDIVVAFGFEVDKNSEKQAESSIKGLKSMATKLLGVIGIGFSIAGISHLAETAAEAEALKSQFSQVFGDLEKDATGKLEAIAEETGVAVNRMKSSFSQIAAFSKTTGMEQAEALEIADRAMKAVTDSAAFYDRSIEDVTASMRSFLKGNFEQDAALGLSVTEVTRNAAANNLYGKSFKDLSEAEKQFTLLSMVEEANKASGALGQAARESDTWLNQLGNLKQSVTDLKAAAGSAFLEPAVQVLKILNGLVQKATESIKEMTGENGILTRSFERFHALVKRLRPAVDRMAQTLSRGMANGMEAVRGIAEKLGGAENIVRIAALAASILGVVKTIRMLSEVFTVAKLKTLGVIAVVMALALIIEDFIHFMMGNDSVIGTFFDNAGIGAENARKTIIGAWKRIKEFLASTWDFIKQAAETFVSTVEDSYERHCESTRQGFERAWGIIKTFLNGVWTFISQLAATLFGDTEDSIDRSTISTKDKLLAVWREIIEKLSGVWDALYEACGAVFNAIATVIETIFSWIQAFWDSWGADILSWFKVLWDSICGIIDGFLDTIIGLCNFISSVFTADWQGAWEAIKQIFTGIWDAIVSFITAVWETIKLVFAMDLSAVLAIWNAVWSAVSEFFISIWDGIVSFISGVWNTITTLFSIALSTISTAWNTAWTAVSTFFGEIWNGIVTFLSETWSTITNTISEALGSISGEISTVLEEIFSVFSDIWNSITSFLDEIWSGITGGVSEATSSISGTISTKLGEISSFFTDIFGSISTFVSNTFGEMLSGITSSVGDIYNAIVGGLTDAVDWIKEIPSQALQWGSDIVGGIADGITGAIGTITDAVSSVAEKIKSFLHFSVPDEGPLTDYESWMPDFMEGLAQSLVSSSSVFQQSVNTVLGSIKEAFSDAFDSISSSTLKVFGNMSSGISSSIRGISSTISSGINSAVSAIKSLPTQAYGWGVDFIAGLRNGIMSGVQGIANSVKGVADTIRSYLHFSVPDVGPLTDYESWMPDFMSGLAQGISGNKDAVLDKVRDIASGIATLMTAATAYPATATAGAVNNYRTSNVTQNVNIDNTYNGGTMEAQKAVSRTMKKSADDATTQMARALAYARG